MHNSIRGLRKLGLVTVLALVWVSSAGAATASVSRSYSSDVPIEPGSIVSLTSLESKSVTLANTSNSDKIIGVSVALDDALIAVDPNENKVQITSSGLANVLVSDLNGDIKVGDKVAVSPFDGIGMKSGKGERIIGLAQTAFSADSKELTTEDVKDKQGNAKELRIGLVQINVIIGNDDSGGDENLTGLQSFVKSLTGRTVSTFRLLTSLVIGVLTLVALLVLVYSAIFGSIISIGRNPMAGNSVFRALRSVLFLAVMVVAVSLVFIYLLLR